jgi:hypothetical protein
MYYPTSFRFFTQRSVLVLCSLACGLAGTLVAGDAQQAVPRPPATPGSRWGSIAASGHLIVKPDDTYLNLDGANYSREDVLATYTWPDNQVANAIVMKFDLSALPDGAAVTGAALHLALLDADTMPEATYAISVHKILHGNLVVGGASGLTRDGATPWTPASCCFDGFPLAQSDISAPFHRPSIDKARGFKSWTITSMVQQWVDDPSTNFGLLLNSDATRARDRYRIFASADHPEQGLQPYLAIAYRSPSASSDKARPKVSITAPAAGATVSGGVSVTAAASDNVGVAGVRFLVDGASIGSEDTSAPYGVTWDAGAASAGWHNLTAVARDAAGNTRTSASVSVKVETAPPPAGDTTAPNVSIVSPAGGTTLSGNVTVTANASDNVGVVGVQFQCDGANLGSEVMSAPFTLSWPTTTATNGTHTLTAIARDAAGNIRASAAITVTVNNVTSGGGGGGGGGGGAAVFSSTWDTATGNSTTAVGDGGRWPNVWEFNGGSSVRLMSVVSGGPNGHNALRVQQRGSSYAANVQVDNVVPPSTDFYLRYYMRNDDSSSAGDHIVTVDTYQYAHLTYMRKMGGPTGWDFVISLFGCGYTYPIGHWGPAMKMQNGAWYRFEYFVDFISANRIQVHPRVYDASGTLILSDAQFRQSDYGGATWNGRSDWTLASYYAAGHSFCVDPQWVNDFGLGNNGQYGAADTGQYWYFSGVEIRTDGWPGAIGQAGSGTSPSSLSALYPSVLFAEKFDDASLATVLARWPNVLNGSSMALTSDVPSESLPGSRSLDIPWQGGGLSNGGHLYRQITPVDDTLYLRYYIKYPASGDPQHEGVWVGGYNPPLAWPNPQAGVRPTGADRFSAAVEASGSPLRIDHYNYWMNMRVANDGYYWGNTLLNNPAVTIGRGEWVCVEQMIKLNNPVSASIGEHAVWINGVKVSHLGQGFPNGTWSGGNFIQSATGSPFEGFRWRTDANLKLNWIWLQNYAPNDPAGFTGSLKFDNLVVATRYIGCLAPVPLA